jgi:hypothetical protein
LISTNKEKSSSYHIFPLFFHFGNISSIMKKSIYGTIFFLDGEYFSKIVTYFSKKAADKD